MTDTIAAFSSARCMRLVRMPFGVHAQRARHAGAEHLRLDDHRRQRPQILDAGAVRQPVERVGAAHARLDLQQRLLQLLRPGSARPAPAPAPTRAIAASSDRPASTQVTSRSIESGSASPISCCRSLILLRSHMLGRKKANAMAMKAIAIAGGSSSGVSQVRVDLPQDDDDDERQQQLDAQQDLDGVLGAKAGVHQRLVDARQLLAWRRLHQPREGPQDARRGARTPSRRALPLGAARRPCRRWSRARAARSPRRGAPPNRARAPIPIAITATMPPTAATSIVGLMPASSVHLHLHLDHLAHPQEAEHPAEDAVGRGCSARCAPRTSASGSRDSPNSMNSSETNGSAPRM